MRNRDRDRDLDRHRDHDRDRDCDRNVSYKSSQVPIPKFSAVFNELTPTVQLIECIIQPESSYTIPSLFLICNQCLSSWVCGGAG